MEDTLALKVKKVVHTLVPDATEDTVLYEQGLDSIKVIQLITALEKEFGITFTNAEMNAQNFRSLKDIYTIIKSKLEHAQ